MSNHCIQRLSERFLLDLNYKQLNNIRKMIRTGYYILIEEGEETKRILTRYRGRYIKFVMSKDLNHFITALPHNDEDLEYVEQFVKEFD